jgi:hypothetical protein
MVPREKRESMNAARAQRANDAVKAVLRETKCEKAATVEVARVKP